MKSRRDRSSYAGESVSLLYGTVFFFEQVSRSCGLTDDLQKVFGNEKAAELLTLAYYILLHDDCYNHLASWQKIEWYPLITDLDSFIHHPYYQNYQRRAQTIPIRSQEETDNR